MLFKNANYYNPLLYETSSAILPLLAVNQWQFSTPIEMLQQVGQTIFERQDLYSQTIESSFSLYSLMECYERLSRFDCFYQHLIRKKSTDLLSVQEIEPLINKVHVLIQMYYLVLLLGKYIHPNLIVLDSLSSVEKNKMIEAIHFYFSNENLARMILDKKLDIETVYKNPTPSALAIIEDLLTLPEKLLIRKTTLDLSATHIFTQVAADYQYSLALYNPYFSFDMLMRDTVHYQLHDMLYHFVIGDVGYHFMAPVEAKIILVINQLRQIKDHLQSVLTTGIVQNKLDCDSPYINEPFPLVLLYEPKVTLNYMPRLGIEILQLATDSEFNSQRLQAFLHQHNLDHVEIMLIEQLQQYKQAKSRSLQEEKIDIVETKQSIFKPQKIEVNLSLKIQHDDEKVVIWFGYLLPFLDVEFIDGEQEFKHGKNLHREVRDFLFGILEDIQDKAKSKDIIFQSCSIHHDKHKQYLHMKLSSLECLFEEIVDQYKQNQSTCLLQ